MARCKPGFNVTAYCTIQLKIPLFSEPFFKTNQIQAVSGQGVGGQAILKPNGVDKLTNRGGFCRVHLKARRVIMPPFYSKQWISDNAPVERCALLFFFARVIFFCIPLL
jgi:hypothetical protein